jgi:hypothetical protein
MCYSCRDDDLRLDMENRLVSRWGSVKRHRGRTLIMRFRRQGSDMCFIDAMRLPYSLYARLIRLAHSGDCVYSKIGTIVRISEKLCVVLLYSLSDSSRERCKIGEVRVKVNGVEISRDFRVRFVGQGLGRRKALGRGTLGSAIPT